MEKYVIHIENISEVMKDMEPEENERYEVHYGDRSYNDTSIVLDMDELDESMSEDDINEENE